jgi:hypothetical protein
MGMAFRVKFLALLAIVLAISTVAAHAGAILASATITAPERGSVSISSPGGVDFPHTGDRPLLVDKTFDALGHSIFTFPVVHGSEGAGTTTFTFLETIENGSEAGFSEYRFTITDFDPAFPVVFTSLDTTFLEGFVLDPLSGPQELIFSGLLQSGLVANAAFHLAVPDPGDGNSYTFTMVQGPVAVISEPATLELVGVGLLVFGFFARQRLQRVYGHSVASLRVLQF